MPGQERTSIASMGIDLGSRYAAQLGFEGLKPFDADSGPTSILIDAPPSPNSKKKKKKRRKKKEKQQQQNVETDDDTVGETDEDEDEEEELES